MKKLGKILLITIFLSSTLLVIPWLPAAQSATIVQVTNKLEVTSSKASLYAKASTSSKVLQQLKSGAVVTLTGISGNFYKVKTSQGVTGYVKKSQLDVYYSNSNSGQGSSGSGSNSGQNSSGSGSANSASKPSGTNPSAPAASSTPSVKENSAAMQQEMLNYINDERKKAGVSPLVLDTALSNGAYLKSKDMADNKYFDHISPKYGDPFDMMDSLGIKYTTAGENLALNVSVKAAHASLMKSSGHKANILRSSFKKVGLGFVQKGSSLYITQWFSN